MPHHIDWKWNAYANVLNNPITIRYNDFNYKLFLFILWIILCLLKDLLVILSCINCTSQFTILFVIFNGYTKWTILKMELHLDTYVMHSSMDIAVSARVDGIFYLVPFYLCAKCIV